MYSTYVCTSFCASPCASFRKQDSPALVSALAGKNVVLVAAGCGHSAAILEDGSLYSWGKGGYGRLGHGTYIKF